MRVDGRRPEGPDADWIHLPDPIADAIRALSARIDALERGVAEVAGAARRTRRRPRSRPLRPRARAATRPAAERAQ